MASYRGFFDRDALTLTLTVTRKHGGLACVLRRVVSVCIVMLVVMLKLACVCVCVVSVIIPCVIGGRYRI